MCSYAIGLGIELPVIKTIAPQSGVSFLLKKSQILTVIDPYGEQVADLFCVESGNKKNVLSSGRSIDYNDTIRFTKGHKLFGFDGSVMMEIVEDTCGVHDFLVTPCSLQMFKMLDPECKYHPSCQENLTQALVKMDVDPNVLGTTFNIFMNVPISSNGALKVVSPVSNPGDRVSFLAKKDLIVALTACSDEGTNNGVCKEIHYSII